MDLQGKFSNADVRRQDRILDYERSMQILNEAEYGFLALGGESGYGIPVNYAIEGETIYIHCAPEGEKLRRIASNSSVSFCVVGKTKPIAEKFTTAYESVLVKGTIRIETDDSQRRKGLRAIIAKYSPDYKEVGDSYIEKSFHRVTVLALTIEHISAKSKVIH